jgi:hypothetical protein
MVHRIGRIVLFSLYVPFVSPVNKFMCIEAMQAQIVGGWGSGMWGWGGIASRRLLLLCGLQMSACICLKKNNKILSFPSCIVPSAQHVYFNNICCLANKISSYHCEMLWFFVISCKLFLHWNSVGMNWVNKLNERKGHILSTGGPCC